MSAIPRGIRNNNPGNIRWSNDQWKGLIPKDQASDKAFCVFRSPEYGIRAMARILRKYTSYTLYSYGLSIVSVLDPSPGGAVLADTLVARSTEAIVSMCWNIYVLWPLILSILIFHHRCSSNSR